MRGIGGRLPAHANARGENHIGACGAYLQTLSLTLTIVWNAGLKRKQAVEKGGFRETT